MTTLQTIFAAGARGGKTEAVLRSELLVYLRACNEYLESPVRTYMRLKR